MGKRRDQPASSDEHGLRRVKIQANENLFNDGSGGIEFDGHYADDVSLRIITSTVSEPASLILLAIGLASLGYSKRSSRA